ncbi:MAG: radical SAM protein [Desulfurococcaceae archaeon]
MGKCKSCGRVSVTISDIIGVCANCLRKGTVPTSDLHRESRKRFGLSTIPLKEGSEEGLKCIVCGRGCFVAIGGRGYCNYRFESEGALATSTGSIYEAIGMYYYDPHPTNCVASPVCPATTGLGYPQYALSPSGEHGYYNIAVFYGGCNFDCIYCQNWEYREMAYKAKPALSIDVLVNAVNKRTTCVCYFGGDPGPFAPHAVFASKKMVERARSIGLPVFRVCWETNGLWNPLMLEEATKLSLNTGGIVKIDFKAWSPEVYRALCDVEEKHVNLIRENIKLVAKYAPARKEPPLLVVSTLLVPGYLDEYEIDQLTKYIAGINTEIPYVFLGFHPDYMLVDLPVTSWNHAEKAVKIAKENGLKHVYVGNVFLLGHSY